MYAHAVCTAIADCGCAQRYASNDECELDLSERFDAILRRDDGTTTVPECLELLIDSQAMNDCLVLESWPSDLRFGDCAVLEGNRGEGQSCSELYKLPAIGVRDCTDGLDCYDGRCLAEDPSPPPKSLGSHCDRTCYAEGLYCGNGICKQEVALGGVCDSAFACSGSEASPTYCSGLGSAPTGTCELNVEQGGLCDPLDAFVCSGGGADAWCDPATGTCTGPGPGICALADYPTVWPATP